MHAFMGYDTVSEFAGKGKAKVMKLNKAIRKFEENWSKMGNQSRTFSQARSIYNKDKLRNHLFCAKTM